MSNMPQFTIAPIDPKTGQWNITWWLFFQDLWVRTGGAQGSATGNLRASDIDVDAGSVAADLQGAGKMLAETKANVELTVIDADAPRLATAISDANKLISMILVDDGINSQQSALLSKIIDLTMILGEAQDVAKMLRQAINDAVIDTVTNPDPIRSMAYQDASRVAIKGGAIDGTSVGATTPAAGTFTSLIGNTALESQVPNIGQITMRPNDQRSVAARNWSFRVNQLAYGDWCAMVSTTNANDPVTVKLQYFNGLAVTDGFGCNGKAAQGSFSLGAAATDLSSVINLANNLRTMSINNGIGA